MAKSKKQEKPPKNRQKPDKRKSKKSTNPASGISSDNPNQQAKQKKSAVSALKGSLKSAFGGHKSDLISLGLIVIGIVAALGADPSDLWRLCRVVWRWPVGAVAGAGFGGAILCRCGVLCLYSFHFEPV